MAAERSRLLRNTATSAETVLWRRLRNRQLAGAKFRRQHPFGPYILDFYCFEAKLVVEVDGGQHYKPDIAANDEERTEALKSAGLRVQRFSNREVLTHMEQVLDTIGLAVQKPSP